MICLIAVGSYVGRRFNPQLAVFFTEEEQSSVGAASRHHHSSRRSSVQAVCWSVMDFAARKWLVLDVCAGQWSDDFPDKVCSQCVITTPVLMIPDSMVC